MLWSLGWVSVLSLPPLCRPSKKRKCHRSGTFRGGSVDDFGATNGLTGREQCVIQRVGCFLVHLRQNMGVGIECYAHICVAQAVLYDLSVDTSSNHGGGVAVTKIV